MSLIDLLSTGPGTFVYHLLVLLTLEAMAGIAFVEWRSIRNSGHRRILWAFAGLLGMRILLLLGEPFGPTVLTPLLGGVELASLTLLGWAFVGSFLGRRARRLYLIGGFSVTVICAVTFLPGWYSALARFSHLLYITFWQQTFWYAIGMLLAVIPALILLRHQRQWRRLLSVLGFATLFLGFTMLCLGSLFLTVGWFSNRMYAYTLIGTGRLIQLVGYPFFTVAVHRLALEKREICHRETEDTEEEIALHMRELGFLVEICRTMGESLDLDVLLPRIAETAAAAMNADRCAIFLTNFDRSGVVRLLVQHNSLQTGEREATRSAVPLAEQPALAYALNRRKQLIVNAQTDNPRLKALYELLGSQKSGPVIVQPILHRSHVLGALVAGNDDSQRPFDSNEGRLSQVIAAQIAVAIENAYRETLPQASE